MRHLLIPLLAATLLGASACRTSLRAAPGTTPATASSTTSPAAAPTLSASPCCPPPCEPCDLGCWDPSDCRKTYLDATASFLPNVGVGIGVGHVFHRSGVQDWAFELAGTYQFLDDETFADDGNPEAGDWYQLRFGLKTSSSPRSRRHFTKRVGVVWLDASGEPNLLQEPGSYYGLYGGLGFETDVSPSLTVGPEISLMVVTPDDEFKIENPIPQLNWHVIWWPGGKRGCTKRLPYGEFYVGAAATLSPSVGAGLQFGQVFSRSSLATWSFEMLAGVQASDTDLWLDPDGDYAQIRGGVKASFQPCECGHWTARAGATWLRATTTSEFLTGSGDYVGAYIGVGYEWDIGKRFTTGPELALNAVVPEKGSTVDFLPQLNWHFLLNL